MDAEQANYPPVFAALLRTRNQAADDALVEVLARLEPVQQEMALSVLLARDNDAALAGAVGQFESGGDHLRELLCRHADRLSAGARLCIADERFEARRAAIALIRASRNGKLAYLLAEGLRSPCRKTVQLAAGALGELADLAEASGPEMASARVAQVRAPLTYLAAALRTALASWPLHLRPEVVAAAARMAGPLEDALLTAADDSRGHVDRALANELSGAHDPRLAGYCLRALRSQPLRTAAAQLLAEVRDDGFRKALACEAWVLADDDVRKSCSRSRGIACLREEADVLVEADAGRARAAVRLVAAAGGRLRTRLNLLRSLAITPHPETARAAMWTLMDDPSDEATEVLHALSPRSDIPLHEILPLELRRRTPGMPLPRGGFAGPTAYATQPPAVSAFDPYWNAFDTLPEDSRVSIGRTVMAGVPEFAELLRAKLSHGDDVERVRGLKVVQTLELAGAFTDEIYAAASDSANVVRSLAMTLLGKVESAASRRLLRAGLDDADDRVQANAIESLEALGGGGEAARMVEKLASTSTSRVRANAVKALVRLGMHEGARTLLAMMSSDQPSDRASALWVVERMRLQHLLTRIERMVSSDPDERVRTRARRLLRKFNEQRASKAVGPVEAAR